MTLISTEYGSLTYNNWEENKEAWICLYISVGNFLLILEVPLPYLKILPKTPQPEV